jgi:hypothetical protein
MEKSNFIESPLAEKTLLGFELAKFKVTLAMDTDMPANIMIAAQLILILIDLLPMDLLFDSFPGQQNPLSVRPAGGKIVQAYWIAK